jgi:hypothetical protein
MQMLLQNIFILKISRIIYLKLFLPVVCVLLHGLSSPSPGTINFSGFLNIIYHILINQLL